ncbi:hypothetical protein CIK05_09895 [Bdellovibrio sp. qaytius]|nr:hypothetical protein CIK05_09895 [Bdellovibrio sp. qaytius]
MIKIKPPLLILMVFSLQATAQPAASVHAAAFGSALPVELKASKRRTCKTTPELEAQVDQYIEALKSSGLAPKEIKSIFHQEDLIAATRNAVVIEVMKKASVDFQGLKFGMLDTDVGKIAKFQELLLLKPTKESEELFDSLRGVVNTPAANEIKAILKHQGFAYPNLLNPNLTNQEIREIIAELPVLRGYLHEMPGMQFAIRDYNTKNITKDQFRERFLVNLGHNGPNEGYWSYLSNTVVPAALAKAKHPKAKILFADTIYASEKIENGVVVPNYPLPQSTAAVVHAVFDRLSQGSRGGVDKIFYELGGTMLADNQKSALRGIGIPPNTGLQLPYEMLIGNPEKTVLQLQALQKHAATSPIFNKTQQKVLSHFVGGAIKRLQIQNEFIKQNFETTKDASGAMQKMTLHYASKSVTFTNDTPADEVANAMREMLRHEESLHGEPFKEFTLSK